MGPWQLFDAIFRTGIWLVFHDAWLVSGDCAAAGIRLDVAGHRDVEQGCRYPFGCCRDRRVGSPGVDRRDHAVPVLPRRANQPHERFRAGGGAWALGHD
jgi:hypothetical protein